MLDTEEELKKKWCPFARVGVSAIDNKGTLHPVAINRHKDSGIYEGEARCIGSACAAWRFFDRVGEDGRVWRKHPDGGLYNRSEFQVRGYCGAAGVPLDP